MTGPTTWSTDGRPMAERVAYWREITCQAFLSLDPVARDPARFFGQLRTRTAGPFKIATIRSAAQIVQRGPVEIRRTPGGHFYLIVQQSGTGAVFQQGRRADLAPGDAVLVDTRRPYTLAFERDFEQFSLTIPAQCVAARPRDDLPTGVRIASAGPLVAGYVDLFRALDRDPATAQALMNNVLELLDVLASRPQGPWDRPDERLFRVRAYLTRHFADPDLGAEKAALANHISVRLLHKLFAATGRTFGETLREIRLEHGRRRLGEASAGTTILDIALESGYGNLNCFSRAFRQRYGLTPSEFRAAARRLRT